MQFMVKSSGSGMAVTMATGAAILVIMPGGIIQLAAASTSDLRLGVDSLSENRR